MTLLFLLCLGVVVYTYFGYPLLVCLLSRLRPRPVMKGRRTPVVSIIIPAHNEERVIGEKVRNSLSLDYPPERLEVIVASDGSTDGTVERAREEGEGRIRIFDYPRRSGKIAVLNRSVPQASGEILVLSDASGMLGRESIRRLVENFADPTVGCVCGIYRFGFADPSPRGMGERLYWKYEFAIKRRESLFCTLLGATGALYALRKELYVPLPSRVLNDDFVIPMKAVEQGRRIVLEEGAVVVDSDRAFGEFWRRVRVAAGNWQQIGLLRALLRPSRGAVFWQFLSHKAMRLIVPYTLLALAVSVFLLQGPLFLLLRGAVLLFVLAAFLGWVFQHFRRRAPFLFTPYYLLMGSVASVVGPFFLLFHGGRISWERKGDEG